ncbi:3-isopropylmalate dehydratase small subunit [Ignicoccus islandicus DSM 13165]|uniref:3-isopropylmalate dehydratase small subunit n=1 Tax=Ignicoccus islandicus DSM 13165 TaxID=940295 RepID=A0A0U3E7P9_9CREN|nr:3-isopropylmalate dehydratase small subunit [Ignicoccus islandicus]ALU11406.1 3-isopropylmalate dehydratase small subunit [Ignicoccus islandicus DSM 13165]
MVKGRVVAKLGDNIDTDMIIPFRYKAKTVDYYELAKHVFEDLDPNLSKKIKPGDIVVAGRNFGMGSSREQAPIAIKYSGVSAVIAKSFARIFFRNAVNVGLPVIESPEAVEMIEEGDEVEIDLEKGVIRNLTKGKEVKVKPYPQMIMELLKEGGIYEYYKKHGKFPWE